MRIRTPTDFGALIRDRRIKLGLDQRSLAQKVGVSRQWIVEVEKGKPRAEIGLLLRTIDALGIPLMTEEEAAAKRKDAIPAVDIDSIVAAARRKKK
jgi:HTH-type transcriptional regulator / antitoxin HipB